MKTFHNRAIAIRGATSMIALVAGMAFAPTAIAQTTPATQTPTDTTGSQAVNAGTTVVSTVQDPATPDTPDNTNPEDIIVTGTRASLQSAIARKKNAGTVVDSIVADDIASFPDKNVGEALGRITGVQLSRDFGEGVAVSIRGVEPDLNRVEINGVSQTSAGGGRAGDFRELAVELVKSIDVYKGYTVDLTEGGIGGTVSVETRRPLELPKHIFSFTGSGQRLDLRERWKPRFNLTAGRPDLFGDTLGVLFNVTYSDVDTRQDYASNTNWNRIADFDRSTDKTIANSAYTNFGTYESCAGVPGTPAAAATTNRLACETQFFDWTPASVRYRKRDINDKRLSADVQLQYRFASNLTGYVQGQINRRNQTLQDTNYSVDLSRFERFNYDAALAPGANGGTSRPRIAAGTFTAENHVITSLTTQYNGLNAGTVAAPVFTGANNIVGVQRRDFGYDENTEYFQTGFNWELDRFKMTGLASRSKATRYDDTNLVSISTGVGGITIDRRNDLGAPVFIFPEAFDAADPAVYANLARTGRNGVVLNTSGPTVQYRPSESGTTEDQIKLDMDYQVDAGFLKSIEYGGQYRSQDSELYQGGGARLLRAAVTAVPAAGIVGVPAVFQTSANVSYTTVIGPAPAVPPVGTYYFTPAQYQQFIATNTGITNGAPLFTGLDIPGDAPSRVAIPLFDYANLSRYYDLTGFDHDLVRNADGLPQIPSRLINEKIVAGYLKFNFEQQVFGMQLSGNAGVRYTYTRDEATGSNTRRETRIRPGTGVTGIPAVIETATVSVQQISFTNSYHDWLPAFNVSLEILPNLVARGNFAKNLARPRPSDLVPNINCNFDLTDATDDVCTAGNPELKPYRADQFEANLAWYPNRDTLVSIGYYNKNIKSFILLNQLQTGVDLFGDGQTQTIRRPINGFGAKLDGFEVSAQTVFSFLPAPFDGFGVTGNFTYARVLNNALTNQATGEPLNAYPGLSKFTYNASVYYDKDWLNVRFNYNRRSSWLSEASNAANGNNPIFRRGETFLDAKVTFRITPMYSVFFEANNLGKEFSQTYIDQLRTVESYYPGQRIFAGVQLKL